MSEITLGDVFPYNNDEFNPEAGFLFLYEHTSFKVLYTLKNLKLFSFSVVFFKNNPEKFKQALYLSIYLTKAEQYLIKKGIHKNEKNFNVINYGNCFFIAVDSLIEDASMPTINLPFEFIFCRKFMFTTLHFIDVEDINILNTCPLVNKPNNNNNKVKDYRERCTYLMIDNNTGYYKIGYSNNPKFRESTLQSEKPTIRLLFHCNEFIEKELHDKYKDLRIRGEWFNLSKKDVADIYSLFKSKTGFTEINNCNTISHEQRN